MPATSDMIASRSSLRTRPPRPPRPPREQPELHPPDAAEQHQHEQRQSARGAELRELPTRLIDPVHGHVGGVLRTTAGQHVHVGEDLERADDPGGEHPQGHGPEQRERDPPEPLPRAGAVHPRGVEVGLWRSEEHTSELQSLAYLVCRLLLEKKKKTKRPTRNREP